MRGLVGCHHLLLMSSCSRLGLVSLAYLWRREQGELLREMVEAGVRAVVIKVAAMGLTSGDLGRTVEELHPRFLELVRAHTSVLHSRLLPLFKQLSIDQDFKTGLLMSVSLRVHGEKKKRHNR